MDAQVWISPTNVTHAVPSFGPRTICGVAVKTSSARYSWTHDAARRADDSTVECRKCRKALQSSAGERSNG